MERIQRAEFVRSATAARDFLSDRPEVSFVGRSNVGKSSLLNALLGRKGLARTSSTPGRTQLVNYFLVNQRYYFVDLPGYGYAKTSKQRRREWAALMDAYFEQALPHSAVVLLIDAKVMATPLDVQAATFLQEMGADPVVVATKIDKLPRGRRRAALSTLRERLQLSQDHDVISFSATTGEGTRDLWREVWTRLQTPL